MHLAAQSVCWTLNLSFAPCSAHGARVYFVGHNFFQFFQSAAIQIPSSSNQSQWMGKAEKVSLDAKKCPNADEIEVKVMILAPNLERPKSADSGLL